MPRGKYYLNLQEEVTIVKRAQMSDLVNPKAGDGIQDAQRV